MGYTHTNTKGVVYYLNRKDVTMKNGRVQTLYYFSKEQRPETASELPADRKVEENPRNGFLVLRRA
jgi:hypothetical protein